MDTLKKLDENCTHTSALTDQERRIERAEEADLSRGPEKGDQVAPLIQQYTHSQSVKIWQVIVITTVEISNVKIPNVETRELTSRTTTLHP